MSSIRALIFVVAFVATATAARRIVGDSGPYPQTAYGYINISAEYDSAMFYAIRGNPNGSLRAAAPIAIFLQGGPGATSLFSDYLETGPTKLELANNSAGYALTPREHTWTNIATMVYVDNPVGTGFSYTRDPAGFSTTDEGIAQNLLIFLEGFYAAHPEYAANDFYVLSESYGGKMVSVFGAALVRAISQGRFTNVRFKGIEIGDGWVSPISFMQSYGPYLEAFGVLTPEQSANVTAYANYAQAALEQGDGDTATFYWNLQQDIISYFSGNINWYNWLTYYDYTADNQLDVFLASNFTQMLGDLVPPGVVYNSQANAVFNNLSNAFMMDAIAHVTTILNAGYQVNILTGAIDLICNTIGRNTWLEQLLWPGLDGLRNADRIPVMLPGDQNVGLFMRQYQNARVFEVNMAGHMVPLDNPAYAEYMAATIFGEQEHAQSVRFTPADAAHRAALFGAAGGERRPAGMRKRRV